MNLFDNVTALKIEQKVLDEFKKEMKDGKFSYQNKEAQEEA